MLAKYMYILENSFDSHQRSHTNIRDEYYKNIHPNQ